MCPIEANERERRCYCNYLAPWFCQCLHRMHSQEFVRQQNEEQFGEIIWDARADLIGLVQPGVIKLPTWEELLAHEQDECACDAFSML